MYCPECPQWPRIAASLSLMALALSAGAAHAQLNATLCGSLENAYGPYDYRTDKSKLPIVEGAHFTPQVEMLIKATTGYIGGDLDYTLRAFPNHHRALIAMQRYAERSKTAKAPNARYDVECYFERAVTFKPDDTTVRMLFAKFLNGKGRRDEALKHLAYAVHQAADNAFTHYNLGLVYFDLQVFDKALEQAHRALALGFPRTDLKDKLAAAGQWRDPEPPTAAAAASAASAAQ